MYFRTQIVLLILSVSVYATSCNDSTEVKNDTFIATQKVMEPLTMEKIEQIPDSVLVWQMFEHMSQGLLEDPDQELSYVLSLSKPQQAIYIIWLLESEVNNGGFNQFYYNSSGQFAKLAPDALKLVGANQFAALVKEANELYDKEKKNITKHQDGTVEGFSKSYENNPLDKLDDQFYQLKEPLADLQIAFIKKNKEAFVTRGIN